MHGGVTKNDQLFEVSPSLVTLVESVSARHSWDPLIKLCLQTDFVLLRVDQFVIRVEMVPSVNGCLNKGFYAGNAGLNRSVIFLK